MRPPRWVTLTDPDSGFLRTATGCRTTATANPKKVTVNPTKATESPKTETANLTAMPTTVAVSLSPEAETLTAAESSRSWAAVVAEWWAATG